MRVAICEDNAEHADILRDMIDAWASANNVEIEMKAYTSAEHFIMSVEGKPDLIFLDIYMKKLNGMDLARAIRKEDDAVTIVFTSGVKAFALEGYEVSAFRYLIKPLKREDVYSVLEHVKDMRMREKDDIVIVEDKSSGTLYRIVRNDICYIESYGHYLYIHMKDRDIKVRSSLKDYEDKLERPQFCKCHRSYMVNLSCVENITKEYAKICGGKRIPVSRKGWQELNDCFVKYYDDVGVKYKTPGKLSESWQSE